jgi:DNA-binding transcriptional MerR regulator
MAERAHLSIGEVLGLLQQEFPDVTISKIRFLESQGLLDPERTPSGYRKFYDTDIARLRWILVQQRENFLPLKVIKDRLDATPADQVPADQGPGDTAAADPELFADDGAASDAEPAEPRRGAAPRRQPMLFASNASAAARAKSDRGDPEGAASTPSAGAKAAGERRALLDNAPSGVSMTVDELSTACGLDVAAIAELERYGLLVGTSVGPDVLYDDDALVVARLAAAFRAYGVEARHLRMYRTAAEREASFFEQVVMPMLKQRNPTARRQAFTTLADLGDLGENLRAAMLRQALRGYAGQR